MITWNITQLESQPDTGIITLAKWACTASENDVTCALSGNSALPPPDGVYIPYTDVSQEDVLNWLWTSGGVDRQSTEDAVNIGLQAKLNPIVITQPLPWIGI